MFTSKNNLVRSATSSDLAQLNNLLDYGEYVHNQLDGWTLDEWVDSPMLTVAEFDNRLSGFALTVYDDSPVAWWRAVALKADRDTLTMLKALLAPALQHLRQLDVAWLTCMAFSDWLKRFMPELDFAWLTEVVTLRKDDQQLPSVEQGGLVIRPAMQADMPAALAVDQAAFDWTWRYGPRGLARMWKLMSHIIVAEQDGQIVGYAGGDVNSYSAHIVRLAVHPACQRHSIGAALLAHIIRAFWADGVPAITLNTQIDNVPSQKLYRRFKFRPMGEAMRVWQKKVDKAQI